MSGCKCDDPHRFRVTGEIIDRPATESDPTVVGTGAKQARVRCCECGGKVDYVGSDVLNMLGIPDDEITPGAVLKKGDVYQLTVDLV